MTPINFPEANRPFGAPSGMDESQVATIPAFAGVVEGGNLAIATGAPIFICMLGGLAPHLIATSFEDARRARLK